jgi:hypothetical protein
MRGCSSKWRFLFPLLLVLGVGAIGGCATTNTDSTNTAEIPWTKPQVWENGLPSSMSEGR